MMRLEFDDDLQTRLLVSSIVKQEKKLGGMSDKHFAKLHDLYLQMLKTKITKSATYDGKYFFCCETCKLDRTKNKNDRYLSVIVQGNKKIESVKSKHQNHNWILIHESKLPSYTYKTPNKKKILFAWGRIF